VSVLIFSRTPGKRNCSAWCHNSRDSKCVCVCGGYFHGKREGSAELREAIRTMPFEVWACWKIQGHDTRELDRLYKQELQPSLFYVAQGE